MSMFSDEYDSISEIPNAESEEVFEDYDALEFEADGKALRPAFNYTLSWDWDIDGTSAWGVDFKAEIDTDTIEIFDDDGENVDYTPTAEQLKRWADYVASKASVSAGFYGNWHGWDVDVTAA